MSLVTWGQFLFVKWGDKMKNPFLMASMPKVNLCMHVTCSFDTFKLPSTHMKLNLLSLFSLDSNKNCQHLWWYLWGNLLLVLAQFLNEIFFQWIESRLSLVLAILLPMFVLSIMCYQCFYVTTFILMEIYLFEYHVFVFIFWYLFNLFFVKKLDNVSWE